MHLLRIVLHFRFSARHPVAPLSWKAPENARNKKKTIFLFSMSFIWLVFIFPFAFKSSSNFPSVIFYHFVSFQYFFKGFFKKKFCFFLLSFKFLKLSILSFRFLYSILRLLEFHQIFCFHEFLLLFYSKLFAVS